AKKSQKLILALPRETALPVSTSSSQVVRNSSLTFLLLALLAVAAFVTDGCAGLVSSAGSPPPPTALDISNVQAAPATYTAQIVWTTNMASDSSVNYGTTSSYGSTTPVDSIMVTSHQVTISGLAAGTTYYYQVNSTDSKGNHGKSGG